MTSADKIKEVNLKWPYYRTKNIVLILILGILFFLLPYIIYFGAGALLVWSLLIIMNILTLISLNRKHQSRILYIYPDKIIYFNKQINETQEEFLLYSLESVLSTKNSLTFKLYDRKYQIGQVAKANKIRKKIIKYAGLK